MINWNDLGIKVYKLGPGLERWSVGMVLKSDVLVDTLGPTYQDATDVILASAAAALWHKTYGEFYKLFELTARLQRAAAIEDLDEVLHLTDAIRALYAASRPAVDIGKTLKKKMTYSAEFDR